MSTAPEQLPAKLEALIQQPETKFTKYRTIGERTGDPGLIQTEDTMLNTSTASQTRLPELGTLVRLPELS